MPQQITISDETWARLKALAEPLTDTAEDVINRLIDFGSISNEKSSSQTSGSTGETSGEYEDRVTDQMFVTGRGNF